MLHILRIVCQRVKDIRMKIEIDNLEDSRVDEGVVRFNRMLAFFDEVRQNIDRRHVSIVERGRLIEEASRHGKMPPPAFTDSNKNLSAHEYVEALDEAQIGHIDNILSIEFLEWGMLAKAPVGLVKSGGDKPIISGTGFLVGPGIMMTAKHVIPNPDVANICEFKLNFEPSELGDFRPSLTYSFNPERFYFSDKTLDVVFVAIDDFDGDNPLVDQLGWHILNSSEEHIAPHLPVTIIHHPKGTYKSLTVHDSRFKFQGVAGNGELYCWYTGDTRRGSSGAPIFNPNWEVVAMHHQAIPRKNVSGHIMGRAGNVLERNGLPVTRLGQLSSIDEVDFVANQGIRASQIVELVRESMLDDPKMDQIRVNLVKTWVASGSQRRAIKSWKRASAIR